MISFKIDNMASICHLIKLKLYTKAGSSHMDDFDPFNKFFSFHFIGKKIVL